MIDEDPRSLANVEDDISLGSVRTEARIAADRRVGIPEVGVFSSRLSRSMAICVAKKGWPATRPSPSSSLDSSTDSLPEMRTEWTMVCTPSVIGMRTISGASAASAAVGAAGSIVTSARASAEAAAAIDLLDEGQIGLEECRRKRLTLLSRRRGSSSADGITALPEHLDVGHAALRTALHVERDPQFTGRLFTGMRRGRVAIALAAQVFLDRIAGVFEQILVGRSFAGNRHQIVATILRQRVAPEFTRTRGP